MACYHPLKGFQIPYPNGSLVRFGKQNIKVCSSGVLFLSYSERTGEFTKHCSYSDYVPHNDIIYRDYIDIPCGQCVGCRLEHSRQWAVRCMLESTLHDSNYFLTLTYSPECKDKILSEISSSYIDDFGNEVPILTLNKKHLQLFYKRLRSRLDSLGLPNFRYYSCGEYGSKSFRPHYHAIMFGLVIPDLKFFKKTSLGHTLYTSELLDEVWGNGHVFIGDVSFESCAYVSRYVMKKQKGKNRYNYQRFNIQPEFSTMSLKPGIGAGYFDDNFEEIYSDDKIYLPGGRVVRPPRYFDNLYKKISSYPVTESVSYCPDMPFSIEYDYLSDDIDWLNEHDLLSLDGIKDIRSYIGETQHSLSLERTNLSEEEYRSVCERNKLNSVSKLIRPLD